MAPPKKLSGPTLPENRGPGIAKAKPRPFQERTTTLIRGVDGAIAAALRNADPCTEGATAKDLDGEEAWFGSTSFVVPVDRWDAANSAGNAETVARWVAWAGVDLHVRLRALRVALGEASTRAPGPLGTAKCEFRVSATETSVRIDVDVEAPLLRRATESSRTTRKTPRGTTARKLDRR